MDSAKHRQPANVSQTRFDIYVAFQSRNGQGLQTVAGVWREDLDRISVLSANNIFERFTLDWWSKFRDGKRVVCDANDFWRDPLGEAAGN